jgi:hypothetical protein
MTLTVVFFDRDDNETGRAPVQIRAVGEPIRVIMPAGSVSFELQLPALAI